jgi:uridine phosphorylase
LNGPQVNAAPLVLKPHEPVAERVLLPGDPGRALRLAQQLIVGPRMLNHHRGLWGYSGPAHDGAPLTIQSTGLGGPSAAVVVAELVALGARRLVRLGTAAGLADMPLGTLVAVESALADDGASRALGAGARVPADPALCAALAAGDGVQRALVASGDVLDPTALARWAAAGARAADLATAAVLAAAARYGAVAGVVLAVTRSDAGRLVDAELAAAESALGRVGFAALA